jgi:hypothetical protein
MPVEFTARYFDANDPDDHLARLVAGRSDQAGDAESPWVEPDYNACPTWPPTQEQEDALLWPGPPMIMPAGLLPDGTSRPRDSVETARRICGREIRPAAEAEAYFDAYTRQQHALRARAGLPRPRRGAKGLEDLPETLRAIEQMHREEQGRRRQQGHRRAG